VILFSPIHTPSNPVKTVLAKLRPPPSMPALPENTRSRTIYHTSYTHSISLTELGHVPKALICVGETGIIEWIEKDVADEGVERVLAAHGLRIGDVEVVKIDEGGIVPGLIDTHTVRLFYKDKGRGAGLICSTHLNIPISELDLHYSS
jgi:hypothetical protein